MGIYAISADYLAQLLRSDTEDPDSVHDFDYSILPVAIREGRACGFKFAGYWKDIDTVESYYEAQMECLLVPESAAQIEVVSFV